MLKNKRTYEAVILRLQADGTGALASLEAQFRSPDPDMEEILRLSTHLTECENAITMLQGYIGPNFAPPPPQAAPVPPAPRMPTRTEPLVVTPDMSATMRRNEAKEKIKKTASKAKTKKTKK
tara:strand:+ start:1808 stop:2173 length:366 start_codon:yes stop_codon:yes gene_type:complete